MLVAPPDSVDAEDCSAAISVSLIRAAEEWREGIEHRVITLATIVASRSVHVPDSTSGNRTPAPFNT